MFGIGSKDNSKFNKEETRTKKLADAEAKKQEKERKKAEQEEIKVEKKSKEKTKRSNRQDSAVQQEKSQLAKDLGIRISNPYGYYPDDVDPIISNLQKQINDLSKENKMLRDEVGDLTNKNKSLSNELTSLKLQISITEIPISLEDNLDGLSHLGTINGMDYNDSTSDLASRLLDDDPVDDDFEMPAPKPKLKLKSKPKLQ